MKITHINIDKDTKDVTFFFEGDDNPYSYEEFRSSYTKEMLMRVADTIDRFNLEMGE